MDRGPTITLHCVRKNGRPEITELTHQTLGEARELARKVLKASKGLYTEIDICTESGPIEKIRDTRPSLASTSREWDPSTCETIGISDLDPVTPSEVLLVEDNAGDALLVGQALAEGQLPVHLNIARDGEQALQILGEPGYKPDLIILDLNIPKVSGFTVLASYPLKKTPVVVFTASQNKADADRAMSLGADECVHKPLDLDTYKDTVTGMVRKWVPEHGGAIANN